jgi:hypothetical protein
MNRIIRIKSEKGFTIVPNTIFTSGLSLRAIGLLTYILHLPDDWILYKTYLYNKLPEGKDAIKTAWAQLEAFGYIKTVKTESAGRGKLPENNYFVYDSPVETAENPQELNNQKNFGLNSSADFPQRKTRQRKTSTLLSTDEPITKKQSIPLSTNVDKGPPEPEKEKSCFTKFISIYNEWFKNLNDGVPPRYDGANGTAAKSLIVYFKKIVRDKAAPALLDEPAAEEKALQAWQHVLKSWNKLDNFLQQKTRLLDINSNIQNIITVIKNGNGKKQTGGSVSDADLTRKAAEYFNAGGKF